ncbi:MAG: hypothetical protein CMA27_05665 [Euryarchaeota archaeon]|nr:hypothetical protein [Euryarchaeota archaeon]
MALECNIDARGKAARIKLGTFVVVLGIILTISTLFNFPPMFWDSLPESPIPVNWALIGCTFFTGFFTIWEGRKGWCIVRAMGFKTKI